MLRATQPITMSKMFLVASAMPRMGTLLALLTVANVVSVANSNFQLATLVLIIGNILKLATFSKTRLKIRRCAARLSGFVVAPWRCPVEWKNVIIFENLQGKARFEA